jgi:ATP-dependent RNA helicase RhlE
MVSNEDKIKLLVDIIEERNAKSVLVFSRTKHGANKVVKLLDREEINSAAIHGNKTQAARVKALNGFKDGSIKVLVATDIAARGIDVSELELVVNYDLPNIPETYVHRIGRTGRAKASGEAISFCSAEERSWLRAIQKLIRTDIPLIKDQPYHDTSPEEAPPKQGGGGGGRRQGGGGGNRKPNSGGGNKPQRSSKPRR